MKKICSVFNRTEVSALLAACEWRFHFRVQATTKSTKNAKVGFNFEKTGY